MNFFLQGDKIIDKLSRTKYLSWVTFIVAFFEATISPILPEAFLLVVLAYRKDVSWKKLSLISALGSSVGAMGMYLLGVFFYKSYGVAVLHFFHGEQVAVRAKELFDKNAFFGQFFAALTPLPDRVFSFLAGAFLISPIIIFVATFIGRLIRISIVAYLSFEYGDKARVFIKKHTKLASIVIAVLLVSYILYKYLQ